MSFIRNSVLTFLGTLARVVFSMASQVIISRVLGPVGKGMYAFLVQIPTVLVPLSSLGLNYANTYYVAHDPGNRRVAAGTSTVMGWFLGLGMSLAVAASYVLLRTGYLHDVTPKQLLLILVVMPFGLINLYWLGILWGMDRIGKYNIGLLIQYVIVAVGVGLVALLGKLTVTTAFGIWVVGNVLTTLLMLPDIAGVAGWGLFRFSYRYLRNTIGYGLKSYAANVMMVINYRLDVFIITGFLPLAQVGLYTTAVSLAEMVGYVGNAVNTALIPKLASGQESLTFEGTPKVVRVTILLTLLIALGMAALGYPLIILFFGRRFLGSFSPLLLLLPGIVALGGSVVLSGDLMARGKPHYNSIATGVSVVLTIILDFTLIPVWGIAGAAVASTCVYTALFTLNFLFYRRESKKTLRQVLVPTRADFGEVWSFLSRIVGQRLLSWRG